jgi:hypothetical protein
LTDRRTPGNLGGSMLRTPDAGKSIVIAFVARIRMR